MLDPADDWTCGVWPDDVGACGAPAVERLVMLNANLPDLAVCAPHLATLDVLELRGTRPEPPAAREMVAVDAISRGGVVDHGRRGRPG